MQDSVQQERTDAKWWQAGGGRATVNGCRERDVERFWERAGADHVDVVADLKKVRPMPSVITTSTHVQDCAEATYLIELLLFLSVEVPATNLRLLEQCEISTLYCHGAMHSLER